ncbi:MAG: FAD/NAD(P)-binding protein [Steroidobacteraceae bacterium]
MATGPRAVVIVGGGFAGAALAVHLLRRASGLSVTLIERGDSIGRGVAYDAKDPIFVLNVPASKMSLDRDRPDDFVEWAGAAATPHAFLPRALYGRYVEARLGEAAQRSACAFRVIRGDAVRALPG